MRITIALCTRRRPKMLARCLDAICALDTSGFELTVSIVENDEAPDTQALITTYSDRLDIRYALETKQGLCHARNRALVEALKTGAAWIAITDDDNYPEPDWLIEMLGMTRRYPGADAFTGETCVISSTQNKWRLPRSKRRLYASGMEAIYFTTANLLLRRCLIEEGGPCLRFDLAYNFNGGEDVDFMHQLRRGKHPLLWCASATINVPIDPDRQSLTTSIARRFRINSQLPSISRKHFGKIAGTTRVAKRIPKDMLRALGLVIRAVPAMLQGKPNGPKLLMKALEKIVTASALLVGLLGYRGKNYLTTDGH